MTLIDERELQNEQEKKEKMFKLIIKLIIILIGIVIALLIFRAVAKNKTFKCIVDDKKSTVSDNILYKDNKGKIYLENGKVFISIRELSNTLGYQFYNNEYKKKGEDKSKCQVKVDNIYTSYVGGSNKIYRAIVKNQEDQEKQKKQSKSQDDFEEIEDKVDVEFEYFTVDDNVKYVNNELYASLEAIQIGFDVHVSYTENNNTLKIETLDFLEKKASDNRKDYVSSAEYSYKNKRLLKYGMVIVRDSEGNYGVASYTDKSKEGTFVASCKYSKIDFNEGTSTLATVTNNDKKSGLLYINNQQVEKSVSSEYEEMKEITNNFDYFLVKQEGKYGIINQDGNTVIPVIFEEIGIEEEKYSDIVCKYILEGKYVPVKQNGKWGLYNIDGRKIIDPQFEDVGCNIAQSGDGVVIIPNMSEGVTGIVFLYNREKAFYGVYNAETGEKIAISLTEVFKKIENGEENYYINHIIDRMTSRAHTLNIRTEL